MATRIIYKYSLAIMDEQTVWMPKGAKVLSAHRQNLDLYLWALVDPALADRGATEARKFMIVGTGHRFAHSREHKFVGTVVTNQFVWHVWEVT